MTRARIRKRFDLGRLRVATAGPGSDPRTWVTTARVDDDPEAISFEEDVGWVVDVTFVGGDLAEEGPVPCRVAMSFGGDGAGELEPPALGCEVIVVVSEGDPNANPVIVGYLDNGDGCGPPAEVAGFPVSELTAARTHYVASPHNLEAQYAGSWRVQGEQGATLIAPVVTIAGALEAGGPPQPPDGVDAPTTTFPAFRVDESPLGAAPAESYVRGDQFAGDLDAFLASVSTFVTGTQTVQSGWATFIGALAVIPETSVPAGVFLPIVTAWAVDLATLQTAIATFRATLVPGTMLSEKIRGD